ncbi:MAG: hypothetical protein ACREMS_02610 [Gemmatimonadaceae bacterium]
MGCDRCGARGPTGGMGTVTVDTFGNETRSSERLCRECSERHRIEWEAREAETRASLEDGSLFEQLREQLNREIAGKRPEVLAQAAELLDLFRDHLDVPLPEDLLAFADRNRRPST